MMHIPYSTDAANRKKKYIDLINKNNKNMQKYVNPSIATGP